MSKKRRQFIYRLWPSRDGTVTVFMILLIVGAIGFGIQKGVEYLKYDTDLFIVKDVVVKGTTYLPQKRILKLANVQTGIKLFNVREEVIRARLLQNKYIKNVIVKHTLPSTVTIVIQERQPELFLADGTLYFIDAEGLILVKPKSMPMKELPIVSGRHVAELLKNRQPVYDALKLIRRIRTVDEDLVHFISGMIITPDGDIQLEIKPKGTRVILDPVHPYSKLYALAEFIKKPVNFNNLGKIQLIDLRFENRLIIRYKPSVKGPVNRG